MTDVAPAFDPDAAPWERGWWWSDQQVAVFDWFRAGAGNLVVRARAGTGKTTTIIAGVALAPEHNILIAAFNKTIAKELEGRVPRRGIEAKTLHSLGFSYVRAHTRVRLGENGERARALTEEVAPDAPKQIARLIRELHTKVRDCDPMIAIDGRPEDLAPYAARFDLLPDEEWDARGWDAMRVCDAAFRAMKLAREPSDVIDFADMIFLPIVHGWVAPRYGMVVVDEAQDMTLAQLTIAVHAGRGRVCVVGDDRQGIYAFRGADSQALDRLKHVLRAAELGLTVTRRCPKRVVELAAQIVPDFVAADDAPDGIVDTITATKLLTEVRVGDFVLSRKNAPLVRVCMDLLKRNVRARIRGNEVGKQVAALIERLHAKHVDDLISSVKAWTRKECDRARRRLPEDAADERIASVCDQESIVLALADDAETLTEVDTRCASLFSDDSSPAVMLSSVHRAKGLEADTVFVLRDTFRMSGTIEEANLIYVAITRAKRRLVWVEGAA